MTSGQTARGWPHGTAAGGTELGAARRYVSRGNSQQKRVSLSCIATPEAGYGRAGLSSDANTDVPRLERFDVEFDLPDAFLPEFPAIFLQNRPELGDVAGRGGIDQQFLPACSKIF